MNSSRITIYSTDHCPECQKAKNFFSQREIAYQEINVSHDIAKQQEMIILTNGHRQVPVIKVEDELGKLEVLKGFDITRVSSLLGLA
ncbi:hypothetical protein AUK40_00460 [Candidatus Wirthbacteria bacterium CG2_30_54_11]|uniref:Glutaredoxin domain-containing protein n=1 Tax=Candidatus Wirthbacteria bacterium CG2_30_54_11 TaxID=1817892 RepID=A0A1J5IZB9_9BACT|nr:MAG: hypothetical protein AUK40_00460 [Candidatus Wirthbacteria bacterium CG2_30_54_11]